MSKEINDNYLRGVAKPADISVANSKYALADLKKGIKLRLVFFLIVLVVAAILAAIKTW